MRGRTVSPQSSPGQTAHVEKMPGHWLLASLGKRVLRPGGLELTEHLLKELAISPNDDVVEFAPGLGITARRTLSCHPHSYTAIERDAEATAAVARVLAGAGQCVRGTAEETGLPDASATVVYGEAMLSMQPRSTKERIVREASRLLRQGGRCGIHELALIPDDVDEAIREAVRQELTSDIHVGVRPLTIREWRELLDAAGFHVIAEHTAPMHLLEPRRLLRDEGLFRSIRFAWNVATQGAARKRVLGMRRVFRKFRDNLAAVAIVARKI
jgi:SAM-dependent methyltransferase